MLEIVDDGVGFDADAAKRSGGLGLEGMTEPDRHRSGADQGVGYGPGTEPGSEWRWLDEPGETDSGRRRRTSRGRPMKRFVC